MNGTNRMRRGLRRTAYAVAQWRLRLGSAAVRNGLGIRLQLDPADRRAQALWLRRGILDAAAGCAWCELARRLQPDLVIDVGANYGEMALACQYSGATQLLLLEPNPRVASCLRQTVAKARISRAEVLECAAGEAAGLADLWLDRSYSGKSSLVHRPADAKACAVAVTTIDSLVAGRTYSRLLMKVDVEGAEPKVLAGATAAMAVARSWAVLLEFVHLTPGDLEDIAERYDLWMIHRRSLRFEPVPSESPATLAQQWKFNGILKDCVLLPHGSTLLR
jgi:FkbM family methyltransferase